MAISFNTSATADSGNTQAASQAVTIPAGVLKGDEVLFVSCCVPLSTSVPVISAASTATTPVQIGPTQEQAVPAPGTVNVCLWKVTATASDPGATVTFSSTINGFWAVALAAYTGTAGASAIDASGGAISAAGVATVTCPSETTGADAAWAVYPTGGTYETGVMNPPAGTTQRAKDISVPDVAAAFFDSNGSVGNAGTSIGGGTFTSTAGQANTSLAAFTISLAPGSFGRTVASTVTPAATVVRTHQTSRTVASTVTPAMAIQVAHKRAKGGGYYDYHHRAGSR